MNCEIHPTLSNFTVAKQGKVMTNVEEIWKDIPGYEGYYQASNLGRIKSLDRQFVNTYGGLRFYHGRILRQSNLLGNYQKVTLKKNRHGSKQWQVHRLIAITFIPNPENKPEINHINRQPNDNKIENLEWCTRSENVKHFYRTGGYFRYKWSAGKVAKKQNLYEIPRY